MTVAAIRIALLGLAWHGLAVQIGEDDERGFSAPIGFAGLGIDEDDGGIEMNVQYVTRLMRPEKQDQFSLGEGFSSGGNRQQQNGMSSNPFRAKNQDSSIEDTKPVASTIIKNLVQEYVGPIGIGTVTEPRGCARNSLLQVDGSAQTACRTREQSMLNVVFDTGSTNLWMASTLCREGPCVSPGRTRYNLKESETFSRPETSGNYEVNFATAVLSGPLGVDDLHIGPFTVRNQTFNLIQQELGSTFEQLPLEGIVGLAFPSMSAGKATPFFDNVIKQKVLKNNMFAFYLNGEAQLGKGAILWGGVDRRLFEGNLSWFPVSQAHYWAVDLYEFFVGDKSIDFGLVGNMRKASGKPPAKLIFDSGTTFYAAEDAVHGPVQRILAQNCKADGSMPDLTYRLKDNRGKMRDIVIGSSDYMVGACEPGFMKVNLRPQYGPAMLLGELFMRKFFTVHDRGDGGDDSARVGLAKAKENVNF